MGSTPGANKERKALLDKNKEINCGHCPYNRGENRKRVPRERVEKYRKLYERKRKP